MRNSYVRGCRQLVGISIILIWRRSKRWLGSGQFPDAETDLISLASAFCQPFEMEEIIAQQFDRVGELEFLGTSYVASFHGVNGEIGNQFRERR